MSTIIKPIALLVFALLALLGVQKDKKLENVETQLIPNNTEVIISQEVEPKTTMLVELTPIPTDTPTPTPTATPTPQVIQKVVSTPKLTPTVVSTPKPITYDFRWANRTALDYSETNKEYVKQRICAYFVNNCNEALIIASHESTFRTNAASSGYFSTTNLGVMQINCRWQKNRVGGDCLKLLDLETNLRVAKQIYDEQGWGPWSTKTYLWY